MTSNPSDIWSPHGTTTFTDTFSPTRQSYTSQSDVQRLSSDEEDPAQHTRRLTVSPPHSYTDENFDDEYSDDNSLEEVDATLNNLDEEFEDTEQALTEWSGSYSSGRPTGTGTFTGAYSATYTGSPSFVSLPTFSPRSPLQQTNDPRARLSRITEITEDSRPSSIIASATNFSRPGNPTPDALRRSALLGNGSASHSRASTESSADPTLPPPGRLNELRAVFESQSPAGPRAASTPAFRSSSPMFATTTQTSATGYGTTSYLSRPSSPSKSGTGSLESYTGPSLLSPPPTRPTTTSGFRSTPSATTRTGTETFITPSYTVTPSYTATTSYTPTLTYTATPSYTATVTPSTFSAANTNTWSNTNTQTRTGYTTPNPTSKTYSNTNTLTRTSVTPPSGLRRPQTSPRSPLASVRNIVALWKERTPAAARVGEKSVAESVSSVSPPAETDGLQGIRRRVEGARARLREARAVSNPRITPTRLGDGSPDTRRNSGFPPGIDISELTGYAKSNDPPLHIGLLWYLNVHASPPYRWQRCQALLYPHILLLSWLAPGGGRGIVALDLLNCTKAQSAYSPLHPLARDDVGTIAASQQTHERDGQSLMDMLVPFQMLYADGVERLAAESLLERQKWVNRIMDSIHPPIVVPDSASVTRSPTGSIRTILSIDSSSSQSSNGSRSTVFVPPLSTLPDISDFQSNTSVVSRRSSLASSYHTQTVDDTVIQNQEYVYRGDPRIITPSRGSSMRRSGSMTDLDEAFKSAINRARDTRGLFGGSPVTISSGSILGKNIFVTPPPNIGRLSSSDRPRSDVSDEHFFSAGSSDGLRSNVSSTYFSQTSVTSMSGLRTTTNLRSEDDTLTALTTALSETQVPTATFTPSSYRLTESGSFRSGDSDVSFADSPSTLSRAREIRRRVAGTSRSYSSGYQTEASHSNSSDKENDESMSGSRTPTGSYTYTPVSGSASLGGSGSGGYIESQSRTRTGSERSSRSGSFSGSVGSGSYPSRVSYIPGSTTSGSGSFTPASGSYTPGSGSYAPGSGSYTPGSGSYTLREGISSSSGVGGTTPVLSSETGYDVCPSSDFTDLTRPTTESETVTPITHSSDTLSDVAFEKYVTASAASTEFLTAVVQSSRASITSFESFPTIPGSDSEYATADSGWSTDYHSVSEPAKSPRRLSPESAYITADAFSIELGDIPSETSTPTLSSLKLGSEPDDMRSLVRIPSVVPSIKSPAISLISELLPEEIPLPASIHSPSIRSPSIESRSSPTPSVHISPPIVAASILSDLSPEEVPLPASIGSPSVISELFPEEIPLPVSIRVATDRPLPPLPQFLPLPQPQPQPLPQPLSQPQPQPPSPSPSVATASSPSIPSPPLIPVPALVTVSVSSVSSLQSPSVAQPSPPSVSLPPLPVSTPSTSLALSPTPTSLESSVEVSDAMTPSSFHMPTTSASWPDDDEEDGDSEDESTVSLSLLPTLPDSTLGSTSVVTPSSLALSSVSTASTLPPSTLVISQSTVLSRPDLMSTISSSGGLSSFTQTSSSILPPGPDPWASMTNFSYESSILQPSPSVQSIALQEIDVSFETSILRPSGSASSVNRMSTIPGSPSPLTSAPPQSPLQPLTPVPVLPSSVSSSTDVATPTSISLSTVSSSSLGRTLSTYSSSSFVSQSSLNSSVFDSRSLQYEDLGVELEEESEEGLEQHPESGSEPSMPEPSTEPSLLSLPPSVSTPTPLSGSISMSSHPSSPMPPPMPPSLLSSVSILTPEGSMAVSITTPQGIGDTEQSSLRTVPSDSAVTERDLGRDIDRLADELRTYDHTRGLENQDVIDNVRALREELRDLADFLHRTPSPLAPVQSERLETPTPGRTVYMVNASVGRSTSISSGQHVLPLPPPTATSLSRATSNASSINSYLSSHHSDDDVFDEEPTYTHSPLLWDDGDGSMVDSHSSTSSGSTSLGPSSPEWPPAEHLRDAGPPSIVYEPEVGAPSIPYEPSVPRTTSETSTVRPSVDLLHSIGGIRDQLQALENGQGTAHTLLMSLLERPEDPTVELAGRLRHIEDLVQALVDRDGGPVIIENVPPVPSEPATLEPEGSVSDSESLGYLGSILGGLTRDGPLMPIPVTARQGPTMVQQLDEILSTAHHIPLVDIDQPPTVNSFVYRPVERGRRVRSESPGSFSLPRRSTTVPLGRPPLHHPSMREETPEADTGTTSQEHPPVGVQAPLQGPQLPAQNNRNTFPTPVPVFGNLHERPPTAPPTLGGGTRPPPQTWYHPSRDRPQQQLSAPTTPANIPSAGQQSAGRPQGPMYVPMPPGPTIVQLPPVFESLMEILRENRLAQLATVDQQRELMRYMRGLNEWLERDVYDRQSELRGVVARVEQLSHDLRDMRAQGDTPSSGSDDIETIYRPGPGFPQSTLQLDPRFPVRYQPVIPPVVPDTTEFQGPVIPPPVFPQPLVFPQPPVFPPVFQPPAFPQAPVIPQQVFAEPITVTTFPPPRTFPDRPIQHGPTPDHRTSEGGPVFIPPDLSSALSRHSTGDPRPTSPPAIPRPYLPDLGPNVVEMSASASSSSGSSTDPFRRVDSRGGGSRRRRESYGSRPTSRTESRGRRHPRTSPAPSPRPSGRSASRPLVVTNPSGVPAVVPDPHAQHSGLPLQHSVDQHPPSSPMGHFHVIPPSMSPVSSQYEHYPEPRQSQVRLQPQVQIQPQPQPQLQLQPQLQPQPQPATVIVQQPAPSQPTIIQVPTSPMPMGPSYQPPMSGTGTVYGSDMPMTPTPIVMAPSDTGIGPSGMDTGMAMAPLNMGMTMAPPNMGMGMVPSNMGMGMAPSNMGMGMAPLNMGMGMAPPNMGMGMVPPNMGMGMAPTGMMPSVMQPMPPMIIPSSSRSSSRSRHRRTPPALQSSTPVIINPETRRHTPPPVVQPPGVIPGPVVVVPDRRSSSGRSRSPARRHSSSDRPQVIPAPMYPAPMSMPQHAPVMFPAPGMMGVGQPPVIVPQGYSRSSSRSSRHGVPYIIPAQQTTHRTSSPHRRRDDYDSRSPYRRRRGRSPYSDSSRSPSRRHRHDNSRSPSRRHRPRSPHRDSSRSPNGHHRREDSRSPPRRRRPRSPHGDSSRSSPYHHRPRSSYRDSSRSPSHIYYPPATGVGPSGAVPILPAHYPTQYTSHRPSYRQSSQSGSLSPRRPPRVEVVGSRPYSPSRYPRDRIPERYHPRDGPSERYDPRDGPPDRYDPRDGSAERYDPRGRPLERTRRGRRYSSEYIRPRRRGRYSPYRSVSLEQQSPRYVPHGRRDQDYSTRSRIPRDISVSTGRSPSPIPRRARGEPTIPGPPHVSTTRGEAPADMTPTPIHRPLDSSEHEPVIIQVPSRSEAALHRPPPSEAFDEEDRAHTPAVSHIGTLADHEETNSADRPIRPVHGSAEDQPSTFGEGPRRSESSHRVHYDSLPPPSSSESEGPTRRSPHPEVHRVDDSRVAGPPLVPILPPTQPSEHPASVHIPQQASDHVPRQTSDHVPRQTSDHVPRQTSDRVPRQTSDYVPRQTSDQDHRQTSDQDPRYETATPFDLGTADDDRGRLEALNEVAERLHSTLITAQGAEERREADFLTQEDRREDEFRRHEGERQHYFEEGEERRDAEARQRSDNIWQELETRLKALPAPTPIPQSSSRPVSAVDGDDISSIRDLAQQAASQHASELLETVRLEREDAANEREGLAAERAQLMAEIAAQKDAVISEKDTRITALEDELARLRAELEAERQQRVTEDSEMRERGREELIERDENIRAQLSDITNLVQDQRDMCETKKALMDARWEQKQARQENKNAHMIELRDMVQTIHDNMERDRNKCEDDRRESQEALQKIIDELRAENSQQQELLRTLSDGWRADCERHHQETIEAVRSTANDQVSFNVQGYLDDFSRALATEVRMLLGEVGRIREERRALQHEIGELLCMKSKYGPGGEFEPDWRPPGPPPAGPQPPLDMVPPIPDPAEVPVIRPAWRAYHPRGRKKKKESKVAPVATPVQPPQPGPSHMDRGLRQQVTTSWSTWHPDPDAVLTPPSVEPTLMVPNRLSPGLFGPRTPSSSMYDEPGPQRR